MAAWRGTEENYANAQAGEGAMVSMGLEERDHRKCVFYFHAT
jgi:hypothetical protein